jgi:hypothetical protein
MARTAACSDTSGNGWGQQGRNASVSTQRGRLTHLLHHQGGRRSSGFVGPRIASPTSRGESIRAGSDELATRFGLADEFAALLRKRSSGTLSDWLMKGEASSCPELRRFAEGIRRDEAAVLAAITERWSNGPVEGYVNRLKMIKRQIYGRAGLRLLVASVVNVGRWLYALTLEHGVAPTLDHRKCGRTSFCDRSRLLCSLTLP